MAVKIKSTAGEKPKEATMRWLAGFINNHRFAAIASVVLGMIGGITLALEPYLVGVIIDGITEGQGMDFVIRSIALLFGLSIITVSSFFGQRYFSGVVAYSVHYDVRKTLFENLVTLEHDFFRKHSTGDLISRMWSDLNWTWRLLALTFMRAGSAITGFIMTFILLGMIDLRLTIIVIIVLAISTAFQMWAGLFIVPLSEKVQDQAGVMSALVQDSVSGIQTLKTFGRESYVSEKFLEENREYRKRWLRFKRTNEPVGLLPQLISYLTNGTVVILGGMMALRGEITLGNFTQFLLYLGYISRVLLQIGTIYQRYVQTRGAMKRVSPLLQDPHITDQPHAIALPNAKGDITFENVGLKEGDQWLLQDINLTIPSGSVVAIVGATGSGKTILVNLLSRVTDVDAGQILIDGHDVRQIQLDDLRQTVAYVPQTTFLFSQPLHENVRMGHKDITDDELERAIHISRVSNDLAQMPEGLETLVGEKGVMLSGGQKQRVAIARAVVRNPAILVLDDALSSVDTQTAAEILRDMRSVLNTRTSIIIAHRIATVKDADFIVVMDEGRIIEQGTHQELIEQEGHYASMVAREARQEGEMLQ